MSPVLNPTTSSISETAVEGFGLFCIIFLSRNPWTVSLTATVFYVVCLLSKVEK